MPHFFAPREGATNVAGDLFSLQIAPPDGAPDYRLTAYIAETFRRTCMAEGMARQFGAQREGDEVNVTIRQMSEATGRVHEFDSIPVEVFRFANPRLGPNYIHLGMDDLARFFDVYLMDPVPDNPAPAMLFFEPLAQYRHWCRMLADSAT